MEHIASDGKMTHIAKFGFQDSCGSGESVTIPILQKSEQEKWPILLWFYVKTLGLYHSGHLVCTRKCSKCQHCVNSDTLHYTNSSCKVCDSLTWNYKGAPTLVTDKDIGSSFLNHCGSGFLSLMWLLLITGITLANIVLLVTQYNSSKTESDIVHVLAWVGIKLLLFIGPFTCLISIIHTTCPRVFMGSWSNALAIEFLVHRLRYVNMKDKQFAGYALFLGSIAIITTQCIKLGAPFFDSALVSPILKNVTLSGMTTTLPLNLFIVIEGFINYGGFCYIVYLLRCSYEFEIRLITKFLCENITDVDLCRARLAEAFDAYHVFREFASGWIAMNLISCTVCLLLELHVWIVKTEPLSLFQYEHTFLLLFFLLLPIASLGNVDVDYLWNRLVRQVSRQRSSRHENSWDKLMQFLQEQRAGSRPWQAVLAFFLSTIAVFAAIQFRLNWSNQHQFVSIHYIMSNGSLS